MTNQEIAQYLSTLLTVAGGGALLWLLMGLLVKAVPSLDKHTEAKFWIAFIGSFIIPVGALAAKAAIGGEQTTLAEWVTAVTAGYQISQGVHRATGVVVEKIEEKKLEKVIKQRLAEGFEWGEIEGAVASAPNVTFADDIEPVEGVVNAALTGFGDTWGPNAKTMYADTGSTDTGLVVLEPKPAEPLDPPVRYYASCVQCGTSLAVPYLGVAKCPACGQEQPK